VYKVLAQRTSIDTIIEASGLTAGAVIAALLQLEMLPWSGNYRESFCEALLDANSQPSFPSLATGKALEAQRRPEVCEQLMSCHLFGVALYALPNLGSLN